MTSLIIIGFFVTLVLVGLLGLYEYYLYPSNKLQNIKYTAKLYLIGLLLLTATGISGILSIYYFDIHFSLVWPGFIVILSIALLLVLLQRRVNSKSNLNSSPLQTKVQSIFTTEYEEINTEEPTDEIDIDISEHVKQTDNIMDVDKKEEIKNELKDELEEEKD